MSVTEVWRWQDAGGYSSGLFGATILADGDVLAAGYKTVEAGDTDFVALKMNGENGSVIWEWEEGSQGGANDVFSGVATGPDGSIVLAGFTDGSWDAPSKGGTDFAAVNLDAEGAVLWRWQGGTSHSDYLRAVGLGRDGSIVVGGDSDDDFTVMKFDPQGKLLWRWRDGTDKMDTGEALAIGEDGSILLAGHTNGDWDRKGTKSSDFAAMKISADGKEIWRWQGGTQGMDFLYSVNMLKDGSVVMCGSTSGSLANTKSVSGHSDFVAVKLDAKGNHKWNWQDGTPFPDVLFESALLGKGITFIAGGFTGGDWAGKNAGSTDFVAVAIDDKSKRASEVWRWQDGSKRRDYIHGLAVGPEDSITLAGYTFGALGRERKSAHPEAVVMMLKTGTPGKVTAAPAVAHMDPLRPKSLVSCPREASPASTCCPTNWDETVPRGFAAAYSFDSLLHAVVAGIVAGITIFFTFFLMVSVPYINKIWAGDRQKRQEARQQRQEASRKRREDDEQLDFIFSTYE